MALTAKDCNANFSQKRNADVVILMRRAKFDNLSKPITANINDLFLPTNYLKVGDKAGAKLDTNPMANNKNTRTDLVHYDPELKVTIMHDQLGAFGTEVSNFVKEQPVNREAVWEVWELHSFSGATMAPDGRTIIGDGFEVKRWVGPLEFNSFWAMGDDAKMFEREFTIKPTNCLDEFVITDASLAPLVAATAAGKHWGNLGLWDNEKSTKIVAPKA